VTNLQPILGGNHDSRQTSLFRRGLACAGIGGATACRFDAFCGLPLEVETPDHASIWRFRQAIDKLGLSTKLLAEVNRQARGLANAPQRLDGSVRSAV
jgi:hypothetical protein